MNREKITDYPNGASSVSGLRLYPMQKNLSSIRKFELSTVALEVSYEKETEEAQKKTYKQKEKKP